MTRGEATRWLTGLMVMLDNARGTAYREVRMTLAPDVALCAADALHYALEHLDDRARDEDETPAPDRRNTWDLTREEWLELLWDGDRPRSIAQVADVIRSHPQTVRRYLALHEIPTTATPALVPWQDPNTQHPTNNTQRTTPNNGRGEDQWQP